MCFKELFSILHSLYNPPKLVPLKYAFSDFQYVYQLCLFLARHGFLSKNFNEVRFFVDSYKLNVFNIIFVEMHVFQLICLFVNVLFK